MLGRFGIAAIAATGFCLIASRVPAQFPPATDPTKDEQKCESNAGKTLSKFTSSKAKCVGKCIGTGRKTSGPYAGCFAPYADPTTNACIMDPVKGAEAKARSGIVKKCNVAGKDSCPECYAASNCTTGDPFVSMTETNIDPFVILIYCTEANTNTPTKDQAKCEDGVSKALTKFVGSKAKCYDKCNANANPSCYGTAMC